jgi:glucose/arabinose dehydrogenase
VWGSCARRLCGRWTLAGVVVIGVALALGPSGAIVARASATAASVGTLSATGSAAVLAPPTAAALPNGFQDTVVGFTGLTAPTAIRFSPDGRVFVAEQSGLLLEYDSLTDTTPSTVDDLSADVDSWQQRGLLGMTLDPDFPSHPYVYVLYTYDVPPIQPPAAWNDACDNPPDGGGAADGCVVTSKLVRLQLSGNTVVASKTLISGEWCQQFGSHSIGDLNFGPDGQLYVSAGEGANYNGPGDFGQYGGSPNSPTPPNPCGDPPGKVGVPDSSPTSEGGALRAQSVRRPPNQPVLLNGTVLRVDPTTGDGSAGNPFASSPDANKQRIVAYGLRNPFRFTFRPGTNELWIGDVGWGTWEEVDVDANPTATAKNFGWPCYEGPDQVPSFSGFNLCTGLYADGTATGPYFAYKHNVPVVPGENCPTDSSVISGIAFYNGGTYPSAYDGALFFGDHSRDCIWAMMPGSNGLPDPANIQTVVAGGGNPVDLEAGPGGDIFYVDLDDGQIHRISYALTVTAPAGGSSTNNVIPTFSGAAGTAGGDSPTINVNIYRGPSATGTPVETLTPTVIAGRWSASASAPLTPDGQYTVRVEQDVGANPSFSAPATFTVDTAPPVVTVTAPANGSSTNSATPSFSGAAGTAGGDSSMITIRIYRGSSAVGAPIETLTSTASSGRWSASPSAPLTPNGQYTVQAEQDDLAGNHGFSSPFTFTVHTTRPANTSRPAVSGSARVRATVVCLRGSWSGTTPQSYAYRWLRDGRAIGGARSVTYRVTAVDAGHTLACRVTARNIAGSASSTSVGRRVQWLGGTARVGRARVAGTFASVFVRCKGDSAQACTITLKMTVRQALKGKSKRTVVVGTKTVTIRAGKSVTMRLRLSGTGRRLLSGHGKLSVRLTTTQRTVKVTTLLASQIVTFKAIHRS